MSGIHTFETDIGVCGLGWTSRGVDLAQLVFRLPEQMNRLFRVAERGGLTMQTSLAPDTRKSVRQLEQAVNRLTWFVLAAGLLITGGNLYTSSDRATALGAWLMVAAVAAFLWGLFRRDS